MTLPEIVFTAAVFGIGVPSMWRNWTAVTLVVAWLANVGVTLVTEITLPLNFYLITDMTVIAAIYCKPDVYVCAPYRSRWHQAAALVLSLSKWDRAIIGIFAVMWCIYAVNIDPYTKWATLWWLALTQFLFAGGEAVNPWLEQMANKLRAETPPSGVQFVSVRGAEYG